MLWITIGKIVNFEVASVFSMLGDVKLLKYGHVVTVDLLLRFK